jgi:DNA-binding FadR family transcriptional regulator
MVDLRGARFGPISRTTLPQEIVKELVARLERGALRAGDPLPTERELAEQLGVGRGSVREALRALTLLGLVHARPGDGTFIGAPDSAPLLQPLAWRMLLSQERVLETVQARVLIEGELAAQAAGRQDATAIAALGEQLEIMGRVTSEELFDAQAYLAADVAFHLAVARAAGNAVLLELMMALRSLLQSFIARNLQLEGREAARIATPHHRAIYEAIRRGDGAAARRAATRHIETKGRRLVAALRRAEAPPECEGPAQ